MQYKIARRCAGEFVGTFALVLFGCGSAVISAGFTGPDEARLGVGFLGVALAFGLTVMVMAYAFGAVSGGHFNPAVTIGVAVAGRFGWRDVPAYVATQVVAAVAAAATLLAVASGRPGFDAVGSGFASNGYGSRSPGGYSLTVCAFAEVLLTAVFVMVILAVTGPEANTATAPVTIGLCLSVIHLLSIPVTNTSVNPARSIGPALFAGGPAMSQLWLFVTAPLLGAVLAGLVYPRVFTGRTGTPGGGTDHWGGRIDLVDRRLLVRHEFRWCRLRHSCHDPR